MSDKAEINGSLVVGASVVPNGLADSWMVMARCADGSRHVWATGITKERATEIVSRLTLDRKAVSP